MQLGKSLIGALVGGAVGIAALIGIHMVTGWDKAWLAILVAIITGLGVRWAADTHGHASYARGALTALIAILAFLAWHPIQAQITVRGNVAKPFVADTRDTAPAAADADEAAESPAATDADEAAESAETDAAPAATTAARPAGDSPTVVPSRMAKPRSQQFSTWDFVWLCVAGLIAYELGRGTAPAASATGAIGSPDDGPPPSAAG